MKAFVYVLTLLFFTITNGQETSWTGEGGSGNNTASNPLNWSNGVPTATSTVFLNDTSCTGTCTILWDIDLTIFALHLNGSYGNGVDIQIKSGATLTISDWFWFGNPWVETGSTIEIIEGGAFVIGENCVANIWPNYYTTPIFGNDAKENWFKNHGTVNIIGSSATITSYDTINIGTSSGSSVNLNVDSAGSWIVTDTRVQLTFNYIDTFNIWGGSFNGSWVDTTTVSIQFYGTNVVLQDGAGGDDTGLGAVTFEYVRFSSSITQYSTYSDPAPNTVIYNTTGVTISNSQFDNSINIVFLAEGYLEDCNITDSAMVNSSSTVSDVVAHFIGVNNYLDGAIFAGIGTNFIIKVDKDSYVTMFSTFSLYGSVTLVNDGTWEFNSNSDLYWDKEAYWVNLGLLTVTRASNDYIRYSTFPTVSPPELIVGTMVNYGTIEFVSGGGFYFYSETGSFRQGKNAVMKFQLGDSQSGTVQLGGPVVLYGYVGVYYSAGYDLSSSGASFFTWKIPADELPVGDIKFVASGPDFLGIDISFVQLVCFSETSGTAKVYDIKKLIELYDSPLCPTDEYQTLKVDATGNDDLPDYIKNLEDTGSCPANAENPCGSIDIGKISSGNPPGPNAGNVNVASLAFIIVSLICLLFKF